jgi:hypothetical protein
MTRARRSPIIATILVAAGCHPHTAQQAIDSATGAHDSHAAVDSHAALDASTALVAQCQTQAHHFATLCAGDDQRPCMWNAYAELCATGDTQLLIDSMNCLDQTTCRTFSDPNEGLACLDGVHGAHESPASTQFIIDTCTACGDTNCSSTVGPAEIFPYLTDADISSIASCRGTSCAIATVVQSCAATVPDLNLFLACTQ